MKGERQLLKELVNDTFIGAPCEDGWDKDVADPEKEPLIITQIAKRRFFELVDENEIEYREFSASLWINAMQKWVVNYLWLVSDSRDEYIYVLYDIQNTGGWPEVLGRIKPDHELTQLVKKAFTKFINRRTS